MQAKCLVPPLLCVCPLLWLLLIILTKTKRLMFYLRITKEKERFFIMANVSSQMLFVRLIFTLSSGFESRDHQFLIPSSDSYNIH
jgi:hypothetical protein